VTILQGGNRLISAANPQRASLQILAQISVHKIAVDAEFTRRSGDIFVRKGVLNLRVSAIPQTVRVSAKKNRAPRRGPGWSVYRRGGRQHLPEGNMLLHRRLWEDIRPAHQRARNMRR